MTDYRIRNEGLLYARRKPRRPGFRQCAILGVIAATVALAVAGHLADRFNTGPTGFAPNAIAATPAPLIQAASSDSVKSGS